MNSRRTYSWHCRDRILTLGDRTLVMGILNTTPDSFSDGGSYSDPQAAVERALAMEDAGADIIDIGGESTRPGADQVTVTEEIRRTLPVIDQIRVHSDIPISIDTTKAEVALRALEAGADIINDVSAFEADDAMAEVATLTKAGVVLMHKKGSPKTMQNEPFYENVVSEVCSYLQSRLDFATRFGIPQNRMVIDPGIGFGKTTEHNLSLLRELTSLSVCNTPLLVGASRKRFIGLLLERDDPACRMAGSLGVAAWSIMQGAHILRVHDVIETCDVCRIVDKLGVGDM